MKGILSVLPIVFTVTFAVTAKSEDHRDTLEEMQVLDLEELMQIDVMVTSAAKKPQRLLDTATALFVITQEDIRRTGVTSIPEALRMAPGVQVARIDGSKWAVSIRGFNGRFANKLLVLIDGRSVYTPLFSGVFWEENDTLLEDIERIEVIRGPGATLWGANAVDGVISVITKRAKDTQGTFLSAGVGTQTRGFSSGRYGGSFGDKGRYRVYAKYFDQDNSVDFSDDEAADNWGMSRGGFRIDWDWSGRDALTLQGDIYDGKAGQTATFATLSPPFQQTQETDVDLRGGNLLGRWEHAWSAHAGLILQLYYDHSERNNPGLIRQERDTWDIDFQHNFALGARQQLVWGLGFRYHQIDSTGTFPLSLDPANSDHRLFSGFVQDDIALVPDRWRLTLGTKFEHNDFTGSVVQPSARVLWTPNQRHAIWASISRAVRTPSVAEDSGRFNERVLPNPQSPGAPPIVLSRIGNQDFDSEEVLALELGYRTQPLNHLYLDITTFYNIWNDLRTVEPRFPFREDSPPPPHSVVPFFVSNKMDGESYGVEVAADWQPREWWRWQAAYSYLQMDLHPDPDSRDRFAEDAEGASPKHQLSLESRMDLPRGLELDLWLRYVGDLPALDIDSYVTLDARLAWKLGKRTELSIVGQNLLDDTHPEFVPDLGVVQPTQSERSVYCRVTWRY